ncbi:MAG: formyltransferase [Deltaproteobacteria bacterium]|nr:formyltransferase [Deltaproteobacteria bacterium]
MAVRNHGAEASAVSVASARCVVFAYQEMGYACTQALLEAGAPIAALFTHEDAPGENIWWRPVRELARRHAIPVHLCPEIDRAGTAQVARLRPALLYSFYWRSLLPAALLELAALGAYNLHGSLLPAYRGRAPVNWMLINGERRAGVTLHHMVARADAGDIVAQRAVDIEESDTALSLHLKLARLGAELVREMHPSIVAGRAPRRPQDLSQGSYFGRRRPEDGRIDWRWPARRVFDFVRALTHPYPGAFCFAGGRKLFVWEAKVSAETLAPAAPGSIIGPGPDGAVEVAAGQGSVWLLRTQFENGAQGPAAAALAADRALARLN